MTQVNGMWKRLATACMLLAMPALAWAQSADPKPWQMNMGKGVTVFLTSHILEIVERLVQSFGIIVEGRIVCSQTVEETLKAGESLEDLFFKHVVRGNTEQLEWIG